MRARCLLGASSASAKSPTARSGSAAAPGTHGTSARDRAGSSGGPAAATAAGLAAFTIGSETLGLNRRALGALRDGVGLRPTFGRVPRTEPGAMALCWSLDKIGPLTRTVEDSLAVLAAIHGGDAGANPCARTLPLAFDAAAPVRGQQGRLRRGVVRRQGHLGRRAGSARRRRAERGSTSRPSSLPRGSPTTRSCPSSTPRGPRPSRSSR